MIFDVLLKGIQSASDIAIDLLRLDTAASGLDPSQLSLVAHRGGLGPGTQENKIENFKECLQQKIWGVEFDVRFSKDDVPFVIHDENTRRTFPGHDLQIESIQSHELKKRLPAIPLLEEVVRLLANHCHLMIEVKQPLTPKRWRHLELLLAGLKPNQDFHLLTLDHNNFHASPPFPLDCLVYVSEFRPLWASDFVLRNKWGGVAGHYLLMTKGIIERHHQSGQKVGVGYISTPKNALRQKLKGADWLFTNRGFFLNRQFAAKA